jgi:26S proteasome regulatory subunit N6
LINKGKDTDDKRLLVEAFLLESRIIFESNNIGKSRGSLTACRANANLIHIPASLTAEIESTAGMLHLAERDYRVAYSYFYEAFEV